MSAPSSEVTFARAVRSALAQLRDDIPPLQFWTAGAQSDADDRFVAAVVKAARTYAAQPELDLFGEPA